MFGPGIYLAESSSKSDEYAADDRGGGYDGLYAIIVCRAVLGRPFITEMNGNHAEQVISGDYDCVLGDREKAVGTYREFVFFHEASIYPEYAVFYRRQYPGEQVIAPSQLHMTAVGTTLFHATFNPAEKIGLIWDTTTGKVSSVR